MDEEDLQGVKGVVANDDLLLCIFAKASVPTLGRARRVCRAWHAASHHATLWTTLVTSRWPGILESTGQRNAPEALYKRLARPPKTRVRTTPEDVIVLLESTSPSLPFCHTFELADACVLGDTAMTELAPLPCHVFPVPELVCMPATSETIALHGMISFGMRVAFIRKSDGRVATIKSPGSSWEREDRIGNWDVFRHRPHGASSKGNLLAMIAGLQHDPHDRRLIHFEVCKFVLHAPNEGAIGLRWRSYIQADYEPDGSFWGREDGAIWPGNEPEIGFGPLALDVLHWS